MSSYFKSYYKNVRYPIESDNELGFRNSQLGAIHAIASFYSLENEQASLTIMPTGSGKTAVLMVSPYIIRSKKVLIVTPSAMVRSQIYFDYSELKTLKKINVFKKTMKPPYVYEMDKLYSLDQKSKLEKSDVVIATHKCAKSLSENEDVKILFDTIIIDEAHHVPAQTWIEIINNMSFCKKLFFTATPFRLDRKEIKGKIIYSYPLSRAYEDGIFGPILYVPVDEENGVSNNLLIAKKAEWIFKDDRNKGYKHYLMVRTNTKDKAKKLELLYSQETNLNLKRIDSSMSSSKINSIIEQLKENELDGIICVDMLGEGFDFPNLKIAAVHEPHKSLASTLQFVGRFARTNADNIGEAKFVAINNKELIIENRRLFESDAVWQKLIIDMSEYHIQIEQEAKNFINKFDIESKKFYDELDISLYSLRPNLHAKIFEGLDFDIFGRFPSSCKVGDDFFVNEEENTIVGIGIEESKPLWLNDKGIVDITYNLYIVHFQEETDLLFIYSSNKAETVYKSIAESFTSKVKRIPRYKMNRVLGNLNDFEIFNSGLQSRYIENGESYRISTGSNVANNIDPQTGKMYSPGHVFCKASGQDNRVTIGYSSSGKIWSQEFKAINEYVRWCDINGLKIVNQDLHVHTNTNLDSMALSEELIRYPEDIFMVDFYHDTYVKPPFVEMIGPESFDNLRLTDFELKFKEVAENEVKVELSYNNYVWNLYCDVEGNYSIKGVDSIKLRNTDTSIIDYFDSYPLLYKTASDVTILGNEVLRGERSTIPFSLDIIEDINWEEYNADVSLEFRNEKTPVGTISLHDAIKSILIDLDEYDYIIYDHSSGEIADYIAVMINENKITATLFHVKSRSAVGYNSSVGELYEVCGQSVKSAIWLKSRKEFLNKVKSRRVSGHCKFVHGKFNDFENVLNQNLLLRGVIIAVQPSVSKSHYFEDKVQNIIAASNFYLKNVGYIDRFMIWGSEVNNS